MKLKIVNQEISYVSKEISVSNSVDNYECEFEFDASWSLLNKFAVFKNGDVAVDVHLTSNTCYIPHEVLEKTGYLEIGVYGIQGTRRRPTLYAEPIMIYEGAYAGSGSTPPTPSVYEELLERIEEAEDDIEDLQDDKQDLLVSGTNIKTLNSTSLLGSGNIDINNIFIAEVGVTTIKEIVDASIAGKFIVARMEQNGHYVFYMPVSTKSLVDPTGEITISFIKSAMKTSSGILYGRTESALCIGRYYGSTRWDTTTNFCNSENVTNKVTSWSGTTNNIHYPSEKLVKDSLDNKQDSLVSGTNIKTINNNSILGSGNINISTSLNDLGVTATSQELNVLDGITSTTAELNYTDGVTSNIQTQLDSKQQTLVSGTNIKTINNNSLLGSGDITIGGSSIPTIDVDESSSASLGYVVLNPAQYAIIQEQPTIFKLIGGGLAGGLACTFVGYSQGVYKYSINSAIETNGVISSSVITVTIYDENGDHILKLGTDTLVTYTMWTNQLQPYIATYYEEIAHKATSISSSSTDLQYPSAKCVYDNLSTKQDALPSVVNDRYLHTNSSTGELEWASASSANALEGVQISGTDLPVVNHKVNIQSETWTFTLEDNTTITKTILVQ